MPRKLLNVSLSAVIAFAIHFLLLAIASLWGSELPETGLYYERFPCPNYHSANPTPCTLSEFLGQTVTLVVFLNAFAFGIVFLITWFICHHVLGKFLPAERKDA